MAVVNLSASAAPHPRVLIVDDDPHIHQDYLRCLRSGRRDSQRLVELRGRFFGLQTALETDEDLEFDLEHSHTGLDGIEAVRRSVECDRPFSVAFVDMRMPPGLNGIETISGLWNLDPAVEIVLSTAYSDFTWQQVIDGVGRSEGLHLLRKPFDRHQARRFACVLSKKWRLARYTQSHARARTASG